MPSYTACVDCGEPKPWGIHFLRQRCEDCGNKRQRALIKARNEAIRSGTHTPRVRQSDVFRDHNNIAHALVARAVSYGFLLPATDLDCVDCGAQATAYDHRDYNKPLDVAPVCTRCNLQRGPGIGLRLPVKPSRSDAA